MDPVVLRALGVLALVLVLALVGRWLQRRDGEARSGADATGLDAHELDALGLDLGDVDGGAVLLGSPGCASCGQVRQVLAQLAAARTRFRWVEVDAADHLDLAERCAVRRVPTVLVVAPSGRLLARASGVPYVDDLRGVLDGERQAIS